MLDGECDATTEGKTKSTVKEEYSQDQEYAE